MTILEQMGNIYSEVGRSFIAKKQNNNERCSLATARAIDLFDATAEVLIASKSYRLKEVLRAKDQYLTALEDPDISNMQSIDKYFMQYAIASRRYS
jgi:hypothetical protein